MNVWSGVPIALTALFCVGCVVDRQGNDCVVEDCSEEVSCDEICEEPCEKECWQREICYEPVYYTTQKCVEKQIPTKKKCVRMVPKEYAVQRLRYVPEIYTEIIVKNEMEYYYVDDWKVRTEMVCERQCEWVPRSVWKQVIKDSCDLECETKQDE